MVDIKVSVGEDGTIVIRFEGVNGSPIVGGICIKRARLPGIFTCRIVRNMSLYNFFLRLMSSIV